MQRKKITKTRELTDRGVQELHPSSFSFLLSVSASSTSTTVHVQVCGFSCSGPRTVQVHLKTSTRFSRKYRSGPKADSSQSTHVKGLNLPFDSHPYKVQY